MKLRCFRVTSEKHIVEVPVGERSPAWFEDPVHRWIDIEAPEEEVWELYNLNEDPGETRNLYERSSKRVKSIQESLRQWKEELDTKKPVDAWSVSDEERQALEALGYVE